MDRERILKLIDIANKKYPPIILIEGVSCVGKSFLIKEIKKHLPSKKILVQHNPSDSTLAMQLINWVKFNKMSLSPFALSCFYLIGQYELMEHLERVNYREPKTDLVILDRSVFISGFVYQAYNGGIGFEACEKSMQLLCDAMHYFFKIDEIFLLTADPQIILQRRHNAKKKEHKFNEKFVCQDDITSEQECYIEFVKKIHTLNKNFPEPQFLNVETKEEKIDFLNKISTLIKAREKILEQYY
jgi:thymidylate kinase